MKGKRYTVFFIALFIVFTGGIYFSSADAEKASPADNPAKVDTCYGCHATVKDLHKMGKHAKLNCNNCHKGLDKHVKSPGPDTRPETDMSWEACGKCHKEQFDSFMQETYHRPARDEKSQLTGRSPNPYWDKLMAGHGFTKEHNTTRSHVNMLVDQFVVDRAFGGRFQPKNGWNYIFEKGKVWDILEDRYPDNKEQKTFIPQSAAAANPVCMQCKTQDQILKWAYMGDPVKEATWSRTSNVVEYVKDLQHGLNCFTCHDPHAAKPRIVRDGLIDALTRTDGDTLWHKDPKHTNIKVIDMGVRGFTRKIALLEKYDTKLLCGQCHVEYNCNPGYDPKAQLKETCLKCHPKWTEEMARYSIDSIRAYGKGKMRKAEFWLSALIDKIVEAKKAGIDEATIKQAQDQHLRAHILWEYWTAENSDGFHNPEMARESLTKSVDESQKGIKILADTMAPKAAAK